LLTTHACQGLVITNSALVKQLLEITHTTKDLRVVVDILETIYQTGRDEIIKKLSHL
jgi:hypothetical protein